MQFDEFCIKPGLRAPFEGSPYMGVSMGYSTGTIGGLGFAPDRQGWGVNARVDTRILSWLTAKKAHGLVLWDLLYLDLDGFGKRTSDSLPLYERPTVHGYEIGRSALSVAFGYEIMAGVAFKRGAVLGGVRLDEYDYEVGDATMSGKTVPLAARVLFRPGRRTFVFQGYYSPGGANRMRGLRVDVPFLGRTHLTAAYEQIKGTAVTPFRAIDLTGSGEAPATWKRMNVGIRVISGAALGLF
jgi:hypothetical protein